MSEMPRARKIIFAALPFVLVIGLYTSASYIIHAENPNYKILPTYGKMIKALQTRAFIEDPVHEKIVVLNDTVDSLFRLFTGIIAASFLGLIIGINMGLSSIFRALSESFITVISIIPALALLPILFITLGSEDQGKIILIFIGTFPFICRDIFLYTKTIPAEQIIKSHTLGASPFQITYKIIFPQIMPRLLDTTRLSFGAGWLFLIAGEATAAQSGLGYRIFLVQRYLAMDLIIPYVIWITLLGFLIDTVLKQIIHKKYKWYIEQNA